MRAFGDPGDDGLAVGLSRVLFPIVALLGALGDHRRDPQQLRAVHGPGADAGGLEPRDHRRPRASASRRRSTRTRSSTSTRSRSSSATVIQVLLPVPWLRGRDGRLQLVIDWRDPAVAQDFEADGAGHARARADQLQRGRRHVLRRAPDRPDLAPSAIDAAFRIYMLPQGMFSVAVATVLFPSLARLASRGDMDGFRSTVSLGVRQIVFLLVPASVVVAVLAEPIDAPDLPARRVRGRTRRRSSAAALAAFALGLTFNGGDADAEPRVLQPAVELDPDLGRAREPRPERRARPAFYRVGIWGIPLATSIVNIAGTRRAALSAAPAARRGSTSRRPGAR